MIPFWVLKGTGVYRVENGVETLLFQLDQSVDHMTVSASNYLYFKHDYSIYRRKLDDSPGTVEQIYTHTERIQKLKVRRIDQRNILYFSSKPEGISPTTIYYLNGDYEAVPYYTIEPSSLTVPDPCHPGGSMHFGGGLLGGCFDFDESGNLYLSTGNTGPCGFYRINGAGETGVTGTVHRITTTDSYSCEDLECKGPGLIYFLEKIWYVGESRSVYRIVELNVDTDTFTVTHTLADGEMTLRYWGFCLVPNWYASFHYVPLYWLKKVIRFMGGIRKSG